MQAAGEAPDEAVCCGPPAGPPCSPYERPGYRLWHFVTEFEKTSVGEVPRVRTVLDTTDILAGVKVRCGIGRNSYLIAPGLYCTGTPSENSPVLVTANYKLSFDILRRELTSIDAWILVLDTRGINVWCAAGKGTFSTAEVVRCVKNAGLERLVKHRRLVLPQLAATGVAAHRVKKECGFEIVWGPVRAKDLKRFLESGLNADAGMRQVTFSLSERFVLIPVELAVIPKYLVGVLVVGFILSGIGPGGFSFDDAWRRGLMLTAACAAGIIGGAIAVPLLLPWLPARAFALKGLFTGVLSGVTLAVAAWHNLNGWELLSLLICTVAFSSILSMNFTGATPFTSPSGVEKEMRRAIPWQGAAVLSAATIWVAAAFA